MKIQDVQELAKRANGPAGKSDRIENLFHIVQFDINTEAKRGSWSTEYKFLPEDQKYIGIVALKFESQGYKITRNNASLTIEWGVR